MTLPLTTPSCEKAQPLSVSHPTLWDKASVWLDEVLWDEQQRVIQSCTVDVADHKKLENDLDVERKLFDVLKAVSDRNAGEVERLKKELDLAHDNALSSIEKAIESGFSRGEASAQQTIEGLQYEIERLKQRIESLTTPSYEKALHSLNPGRKRTETDMVNEPLCSSDGSASPQKEMELQLASQFNKGVVEGERREKTRTKEILIALKNKKICSCNPLDFNKGYYAGVDTVEDELGLDGIKNSSTDETGVSSCGDEVKP